MLKSNTGGQTVCKKKNLSWLFGVDRKISPSVEPRDAKQWPSDRLFFYPHLTPMKDSYTLMSVLDEPQWSLKWAAAWQNQQYGLWAPLNLRSAWASAQSDQSSQCTQWVAKDPRFPQADSKDSDQTGQMPRLIWVFTGRTDHFVGFVVRRLKYT